MSCSRSDHISTTTARLTTNYPAAYRRSENRGQEKRAPKQRINTTPAVSYQDYDQIGPLVALTARKNTEHPPPQRCQAPEVIFSQLKLQQKNTSSYGRISVPGCPVPGFQVPGSRARFPLARKAPRFPGSRFPGSRALN